MARKLLNYVLLVFFITQQCPTDLYAQNPSLEWAKEMGGSGFDFGGGVAVDANFNAYITGSFEGTADFDPGPATANLSSNGGTDMFVAKYNATGGLVWAKNIGGTDADAGAEVAVDAAGNVYVTGYFEGTTDFDPGVNTVNLISNGGHDIFVAKYDAAGNYVWAKGMGSTSHEGGFSVGTDASGNVYFSGYFQETVDFDAGAGTTNLISNGSTDIFIAKYDASGNYLWAKGMGGTDQDWAYHMAVDAGGNTYITGHFAGTVDFDPGTGTANVTSNSSTRDIFAAKYDATGNYVWAIGMGSNTNDDDGYDIAVDPTGNVYVSGMFPDVVDFDPGPATANLTASGYVDFFLAKFDGAGNYLWAKNVGAGSSSLRGFGVSADAMGNAYITGVFQGPSAIDFDPGPGTANLTPNGQDIFLARYDAAGNYVWAKNMGGAGGDVGQALTVDAAGNVYGTGYFEGPADFDPGPGTLTLTGAGILDAFLLKLSQPSCITSSITTASACSSYTFNGQTYTTAGSHAQTFTNAAGCDSFAILNLNIATNSSAVSATACDSFLFSGIFRTSSGIYTGTFTNAAGCDSVVTLNLTVNHSSPVTHQTETTCTSFLFNGVTYTQSGSYADTFTNAIGCDSIIVLDLTIAASDTLLTLSACDSLVLNGSVYTFNGTYTQVLPNAAGCDSTITLQLTVNSSPQASVVQTGAILISGSADAYQWVDCANGFSALSGATDQSYTATGNGSYAVVVTSASGCSDTSDCFEVTGLGINELGLGNTVQVYPNPANGQVTIKTERALKNATIRLIGVVGQTLQEHTKQYGSFFTLDISEYAAGVYFAEIGEGGNIVRLRIVKNDQ